jgi:hypothetical protein
MALQHSMFVAQEAHEPTLVADSIPSLLHAAQCDDSLTHASLRAFATGELGPPVVDHDSNAKHKGILGPFQMSELCKKLNNPKKMDSLMSFLARVAESSSPSALKGILSSLGLSCNHYALRRNRMQQLLLDPDATAKLPPWSVQITNADNVHCIKHGRNCGVKQTRHISYHEVHFGELWNKGVLDACRKPKALEPIVPQGRAGDASGARASWVPAQDWGVFSACCRGFIKLAIDSADDFAKLDDDETQADSAKIIKRAQKSNTETGTQGGT